jgi:hypothetical protein
MSKRTKKKREVRELVKGKFIRMASSYKKYKNPYDTYLYKPPI